MALGDFFFIKLLNEAQSRMVQIDKKLDLE